MKTHPNATPSELHLKKKRWLFSTCAATLSAIVIYYETSPVCSFARAGRTRTERFDRRGRQTNAAFAGRCDAFGSTHWRAGSSQTVGGPQKAAPESGGVF